VGHFSQTGNGTQEPAVAKHSLQNIIRANILLKDLRLEQSLGGIWKHEFSRSSPVNNSVEGLAQFGVLNRVVQGQEGDVDEVGSILLDLALEGFLRSHFEGHVGPLLEGCPDVSVEGEFVSLDELLLVLNRWRLLGHLDLARGAPLDVVSSDDCHDLAAHWLDCCVDNEVVVLYFDVLSSCKVESDVHKRDLLHINL
jgi:hypothetical protein